MLPYASWFSLNLNFFHCKMSFTVPTISSSLLDPYDDQMRYFRKVLLFLATKHDRIMLAIKNCSKSHISTSVWIYQGFLLVLISKNSFTLSSFIYSDNTSWECSMWPLGLCVRIPDSWEVVCCDEQNLGFVHIWMWILPLNLTLTCMSLVSSCTEWGWWYIIISGGWL